MQYAILSKSIMRTARNYFIVSLAVSDLVLCSVTMPLTLWDILRWVLLPSFFYDCIGHKFHSQSLSLPRTIHGRERTFLDIKIYGAVALLLEHSFMQMLVSLVQGNTDSILHSL